MTTASVRSVHPPQWVSDSVFYQVFLDRFARQPLLDPSDPCMSASLEPWQRPPSQRGFKGGNLYGLVQRLDYLDGIGVNALYLGPVFQSASNHRYHTDDYYRIDPLIGGDAAFRQLIDKAHRLGFRVVIDGVFNHCGRGFFFFHDIVENGIESPWVSWFRITRWPIAPYDTQHPSNYACWHDNRALPELNHDNSAVREYIMRVAEYWTRFGVDGWRLDEAGCIGAERFWEELCFRIKAINPDAYLVGEVIGSIGEWANSSRFDGVTNYELYVAVLAFAGQENAREDLLRIGTAEAASLRSAEYFAQRLAAIGTETAWENQLSMLNFLENHDTPRALSVLSGDSSSLELALLLLVCLPGVPCVYYGGEVGLEGEFDPDSRRAFPEQSEWNHRILDCYRALLSIRRRNPALRRGRYSTLFSAGTVLAFCRSVSGQRLVILLNAGKAAETLRFTATSGSGLGTDLRIWWPQEPLRVLYGEGNVRWSRDGPPDAETIALTVGPKCGAIIETS